MNSFDFSSNIQNGLDYAAGISSAMGEGEAEILAVLMSFLLSFGLILLLTLPIVILQYVFYFDFIANHISSSQGIKTLACVDTLLQNLVAWRNRKRLRQTKR